MCTGFSSLLESSRHEFRPPTLEAVAPEPRMLSTREMIRLSQVWFSLVRSPPCSSTHLQCLPLLPNQPRLLLYPS